MKTDDQYRQFDKSLCNHFGVDSFDDNNIIMKIVTFLTGTKYVNMLCNRCISI